MESTALLYQTLVQVLGCHSNWLDVRHFKTLAWMINGVILSGKISLGEWAVFVQCRAQYPASVIRRFRRFLDNKRIEVHPLYAPLFAQALQGWDHKTVYIALDTSLLWNTYCIVRLSLIYRGRAVPIVWKVFEHGSASIAYEEYQALLDQAAQLLFSFHCKVIFLADRGFADTNLMRHLRKLGWHFRIRIKENFYIYRPGRRARQVKNLGSKERWVVISSEPTSLETFQEYGLRFDIEENFLDDKSNGFQLEASLIRSVNALERLCCVLAITTIYLVSQ